MPYYQDHLYFFKSSLGKAETKHYFCHSFDLKVKLKMYAIVNIQGQQFKVEKDQELYVHRLPNGEGESISTEDVLLVDADGNVQVGTPMVSGASVTFKVLSHLKGDKVIVFKKKRRKGYKTKNGHRQQFSKIQIEAINN